MKIDQQIYGLLCNRNERGLSLLYQNYSESLYSIAVRTLSNHSFAEDALQKSFLKIWNNIEQYDSDKTTLFTWMSLIVQNTSIDIRRLKKFQIEEKSDSFDTNAHSIEKVFIDTDGIDTRKMIEGLDDKYAFVLEHLYLKGYSQSELADEFDIPIGSIKTKIKKSIQILRTRLDKEKKFIFGIYILITIIVGIL